jgi:hypothetical protein
LTQLEYAQQASRRYSSSVHTARSSKCSARLRMPLNFRVKNQAHKMYGVRLLFLEGRRTGSVLPIHRNGYWECCFSSTEFLSLHCFVCTTKLNMICHSHEGFRNLCILFGSRNVSSSNSVIHRTACPLPRN